MKAYMTADLLLVECQVRAESGHRERTMKRASVGEHLKSVTGPVFCLRLYHNPDSYQFALVLRRSLRALGAYERLGILDFESARSDCNGDWLPAGKAWFADAERRVVRIV